MVGLKVLNSPARYYDFDRRSHLPLETYSLWQMIQGIVRAVTWREDGSLIVLGIFGPGDLVGRPLCGADPYQLECLTAVSALQCPTDQWPDLIKGLIAHARQSNQLLEIVQCRRTNVALEQMLHWLSKRFGQETEGGTLIDIQLTHQDLAELIGATRVTVTKLLNDFEKQGIITRNVTRRRILIRK